jgi:hypothetical protein
MRVLRFSGPAQKRPINSRFSVIFETPVVAVRSHNFCFKSAMFQVEVGAQSHDNISAVASATIGSDRSSDAQRTWHRLTGDVGFEVDSARLYTAVALPNFMLHFCDIAHTGLLARPDSVKA